MEASMIFETISFYTNCHRLVFLKIVSDHMNILDWKSINVESLIQKQIESISKIINSYNIPIYTIYYKKWIWKKDITL